jgi:integrase
VTQPKLLDQYRERLRIKHYSLRTEQAYLHWVRRFIYFHSKRHPAGLGGPEVERFLSDLATEGRVSASTQNQALAALLFLYREVLGKELPWMDGVVRAKRPARVPVVLSENEVRALLAQLDGKRWLVATLLYATGMRLLSQPVDTTPGAYTMSRCSMPLVMSLSFASLPCSLMLRRTSLVESAKRSASS